VKKSTRRRPELESLESLMLLSASGAHHGGRPPAHVAPVTVALSGTIHATGQIQGNHLTVKGSGDLNPVGHATLQYSTRVDNPSLSVTLETKHGKLLLVGDSPIATATTSGSTHYRVIGGTGSYTQATGSGTASVALGTPHNGREPLGVTFS